MKSKIDYTENNEGRTTMYINYNSYNSDSVDWVSLESLFQDHDFIDLLFLKLIGKKAIPEEKKLFLKTLLSVSMGVGHEPPSIFIPKTISSVTKDKRFAVINGLIGGLTSFGTSHLGAIYDIMQLYLKLKDTNIKKYVEKKLKNGGIIPGFGHPVYNKDPRPDLLSAEIDKYFLDNVYKIKYNQLEEILVEKKGLRPNVDAIVGLSYTCLGFQPEHGLYLSFIARSLSMVCHILEEQERKPFSFFLENTCVQDNKKNGTL
jgi:citrate synthase